MTNEEALLLALNGAQTAEGATIQPQNNKQAYLAYALGLITDASKLPEPKTAEEALLKEYCINGGGGGTGVVITNANRFFYNGERIDQISEMKSLFGAITDAAFMFSWLPTTVAEVDLSGIDFSKCKSMNELFSNSRGLTLIKGLNDMNTQSVTDMGSMFYSCQNLSALDVSSFDVSKVVNFNSIFSDCSSLKELDLSAWRMGKPNNVYAMFRGCSKIKTLDLTGFDVSEATTFQNLFYSCRELAQITGLSSFNTSKITSMYAMFSSCKSIPNSVFSDIEGWDVSAVINMQSMFNYCSGLTKFDMSRWNMVNVTKVNSMFQSCDNLEEITGFSCPAVTSSYISATFPTGGALKRMTFRTDLETGKYAIKSDFDISGDAFERAGLIDMFNTLPDITPLGVTRSITITDNPGVTGTRLDVSGYEVITDEDRAIATSKGWTLVE